MQNQIVKKFIGCVNAIASLKLKRKVVFRERFRKFDDAVKARKKAEEKYFKPIIENAKNTGLF